MAKIEKAYSSVVVTDVSGSLIKSVDVMYYLYNHLLEVSADGENWNVLFDSDLAGSYAETEDGRTYHFSNYAIDKTLSQLKIEQDNILP